MVFPANVPRDSAHLGTLEFKKQEAVLYPFGMPLDVVGHEG